MVFGDNHQCEVADEGTIRIERRLADGLWKDARLNNVLHVPDMGKYLYSVGVATERGVDIRFRGNSVSFHLNEEEMAQGIKQTSAVYRMFFE